MGKKSKQNKIWVGLALVLAVIVLVAFAVINAMRGQATGDVTISGESEVIGLVCKDTTLIHPAFTSKLMISHADTITANFRDDKLSSISLVYEAVYETEQMAEEAKAFAEAEYNLTLTDKYGEKIDIFSSGFSVDGTKLQLVQTARDISKVNTKTVTYFLLDQGTNIAKTFDELKEQYEKKGFYCEKSD